MNNQSSTDADSTASGNASRPASGSNWKVTAMLVMCTVSILAFLIIFGILKVSTVEVAIKDPAGQPQQAAPAAPQQGAQLPQPQAAPAPQQTAPKVVGHLGRLIEDAVYYEEGEIEGIKVYDKALPVQLELSAQHLSSDELEELRAAAEQEINRPKGRANTVTKVTNVRYLLSGELDRVVGALVYIEGTNANGDPLAEAGKVAATRLVFAPHIWTPEHSGDWAAQLLSELHDRLGEPDRGGVLNYRVIGVRTRLVQLPQ